jgi:hypothetical protein
VCISALGSIWQCAQQCAALSVSAAVCGSVWQCVQQCVAVRAAVCGSAHDSVCAVRMIVCISVLGTVWQCAQRCAALSSSVRQCAAVCGSVRQQCGSLRFISISESQCCGGCPRRLSLLYITYDG